MSFASTFFLLLSKMNGLNAIFTLLRVRFKNFRIAKYVSNKCKLSLNFPLYFIVSPTYKVEQDVELTPTLSTTVVYSLILEE